jgi:general secretion pathway protein D
MRASADLAHPVLRFMRLGLAALALMVIGAPAAAQGPSKLVALQSIRVVTENADSAKFELTFDPEATSYTPVLGPPIQPGIGFASAVRGPQAVQPAGLKGFVRSMQFAQEDRLLIVRFNASTAATLNVSRTGARTIEVEVVSSVKPPGSTSSSFTPSGTSGGVPNALYAPPGQDSFELVMLKYADVSEIVGLLTDGVTIKSNDVFVPREPSFGSNSLTGNNNYVPSATPTQPGESDDPLGQSIDSTMAIDRRLNAIWLRGSPEQIARMKAMIAMIDIPVDSVILETQMVELNEQGQTALGIEFNNANGQIGVATFQSGQFIPPGVFGNHHVTSAQFQAALYAQIQKGNGKIISKPRIAALSGSTAKIITGDALPILTAITLSGVNGVSQQVQYVNVGVTLQIAPRVSADGFVTSHVYCVVSSVTGFQQGYPTISQRQAETATTVRDGDSFVIGGLTQEESLNTRNKVPLLGDIPLLGQAFRTDKSTRSKTELYIIVTPRIIHRVGASALTAPRLEEYDERPVATVPGALPVTQPTYVPLTPVPEGGTVVDQPQR